MITWYVWKFLVIELKYVDKEEKSLEFTVKRSKKEAK